MIICRHPRRDHLRVPLAGPCGNATMITCLHEPEKIIEGFTSAILIQ